MRELKEKRVSECLWELPGYVPSTKSRSEMNCQTLENINFEEHNVVKTNECRSMEPQVDDDKTTTLLGELSIGKTKLQVSIHFMMHKTAKYILSIYVFHDT